MTTVLIVDDDPDIRGVDDYIAKPFSPKEMLGRIQAVLARSEAHA